MGQAERVNGALLLPYVLDSHNKEESCCMTKGNKTEYNDPRNLRWDEVGRSFKKEGTCILAYGWSHVRCILKPSNIVKH